MPKLKERPTSDDAGLIAERSKHVNKLIDWLIEVPKDWIEHVSPNEDLAEIETIDCSSYEELLTAWKTAFKWRQDMDDVLSVMLAVTASTLQQGDQLFLMVISNASGGKTEFCDGLTSSKHCYQLEQLTGFFSGVKDREGNDYSLITRVNKTCMVTSEGDVMMNNPQFNQIMAQQRRIFDGKASATYKTLLEDRFYEGLRLTWIIAGTHAIMERDQASLGDRFLKIVMDSPSDKMRREIQNRISQTALDSVRQQAEGGKTKEGKIREAQSKTGGYVDWLRSNTDKLRDIGVDDKYLTKCEDLAQLVAILRVRPPKSEHMEVTVEEPNRLTHQFVRLMVCLSLVLNKSEVDDEVMRRVTKVSLDTGRGVVLELLRFLYNSPSALRVRDVAEHVERTEDYCRKLLRFLDKIGVVTNVSPTDKGQFPPKKPLWTLSDKLVKLCTGVLDAS